MKRLLALMLCVLASTQWAPAQEPNPQPVPSAASSAGSHLLANGTVPLRVVRAIESGKLHAGDSIELETSGAFKLRDGTLIPKGSKVSGHVISSKARSKGDPESELKLDFDRLNANGKQFSIKGVLQAVFPRPEDTPTPFMGGTESVSPVVTDTRIGSNPEAASRPSPVATPDSVGVQGIHGLQLNHGVLSSPGKQVKLDRGVRMIVHVNILG